MDFIICARRYDQKYSDDQTYCECASLQGAEVAAHISVHGVHGYSVPRPTVIPKRKIPALATLNGSKTNSTDVCCLYSVRDIDIHSIYAGV